MEIIKVFVTLADVYRTLSFILCSLAALFLQPAAKAGTPSIGIYNSLKGFGATVWVFPDIGPANTFTLYADIYGMPLGEIDKPGVKFNYSRNYAFATYDMGQTFLALYAGPGASLGYVYDNGKSNPGIMAALSGTAGIHADFNRRISLSAGFSAEFGLHLRNDRNFDIWNMSFYKNGFFQAWQPYLSILFFL